MEMTEKEALELYDNKFYEKMNYKERALFQLTAERLCMPFDVFHEAVEKTLERPVFTHEFAFSRFRILKEIVEK